MVLNLLVVLDYFRDAYNLPVYLATLAAGALCLWFDRPAMKKSGSRGEELFSQVAGWLLIVVGTVAYIAFLIWDLLG
ncbi:MAG: hypothetical protein M1379_11965 [Firmicutes bacterium]|nr:hypothetical protein [Bacillota bacterium]